MTYHIITLFPESLDSYINSSIVGRAISDKKIKIKFYNPRDFVKAGKSQKGKDKPYLRVDDKPFGGGPGMVMQALPVIKAIEAAIKNSKIKRLKDSKSFNNSIIQSSIKIIFFSPSGKIFDTTYAKTVAKKYTDIIMICGRYEGIDERVKKVIKDNYKIRVEDISVGDFVLTGGELPAMVLMDSISRQIPGVLGNFGSLEESRSASSDVYTRPEVLEYKSKKYRVPKVLLSGHHAKIDEWRNKRK